MKLRRQGGAILIDNLEIANIDVILNGTISGEAVALVAEFKLALNNYLNQLVKSPVRSLSDVIAFNNRYPDLVSLFDTYKKFGLNMSFWGS